MASWVNVHVLIWSIMVFHDVSRARVESGMSPRCLGSVLVSLGRWVGSSVVRVDSIGWHVSEQVAVVWKSRLGWIRVDSDAQTGNLLSGRVDSDILESARMNNQEICCPDESARMVLSWLG